MSDLLHLCAKDKKEKVSIFRNLFSGFDRMFPNQDFLQEGGLGNLIALPLQYHARQKGNTLFLDPDNTYIPYINQWNFLSTIRKISEIEIDLFIKSPSADILLPISEKRSLRITISNYISIPIKDTDRQFYQFLRKNLVIHNPIFYDKKAKGFST